MFRIPLRTRRLRAALSAVILGGAAAGVVAGHHAVADDRASTVGEAEPAAARDKVTEKEETAGSVAERLSQDDYAARQQATLRLWRERATSRESVREAAGHDDPEVAARALWVLRQWQRGALPAAPGDLARLIGQSDDGPWNLLRLLEAGRFAAAVVAVEESAGTERQPAVQQRVAKALERRFPFYIDAAIDRGTLSDLLRLVDAVAVTESLALCRIELMQQMGRQLSPEELLPKAARSWSGAEQDRVAVIALMLLGRREEAFERARAADDPELLRRCRMLAGRWEAIVEEAAGRARRAAPGSLEAVRAWATALPAADRCGAAAIRGEAVEQLISAEAAGGAEAVALRWKSLVTAGELDAALKILGQHRPDEAAVAAVAAARPQLAFQVLDYPLAETGSQLDRWIEAALQNQTASEANQPTEDVTRLLALMRCLLSVGRESEARTIAERLSRSDVKVGRLALREYVLSTLTVTPRKDWVPRLAVQPGETAISTTSQQSVARTLPDADITTLKTLMEAFKKLAPETPLRERLLSVAALMRGEVPGGFDPATDFQQLYQQLLEEGSGQFERIGGRMVFQPRMKLNVNLARLFLRHGEVELGQQCLEQLKRRGSTEAAFLLAKTQLQTGRAEAADQSFREIWRSIAEQGRRRGGLGAAANNLETAVKTLVGSLAAAQRRGHRERTERLQRQLRLTLCGPSLALRIAIASDLADQGEQQLARSAYRSLLPITALGGRGEFYDVAGDYASLMHESGEPAEAARWFDRALGETIGTDAFPALAYVTLPRFAARWALEAAIERGDAEAAEQHVRRIWQLDPLDIDFAERLLPKMRDAGMRQLADQTLDRVLDRGLEHARAFPLDATLCNNLAWVAAVNGHRLEDALKLSQRAVWREPESAVYRDTLAEILFRLDRRDEALRIERACLLDDPRQWHLHQQIARFEQEPLDDSPSRREHLE